MLRFAEKISPENKYVDAHEFKNMYEKTKYGRNILHYIALHNIVEWIIPPFESFAAEKDDNGDIPLFFSSTEAMTRRLIDVLQSDPKTQNSSGRAAIHIAAMNGKHECIQAMSSYIHDRTAQGESALLLSLQYKQYSIAKQLIDLGARDEDALRYAVDEKLDLVISSMIDAGFLFDTETAERMPLSHCVVRSIVRGASFSLPRVLFAAAALESSDTLETALRTFRFEQPVLQTALFHTCSKYSAHRILKHMNEYNRRSALLKSVRRSRIDLVQCLLSYFDSVDDVVDTCGCTCEFLSSLHSGIHACVLKKIRNISSSAPPCSLMYFCSVVNK